MILKLMLLLILLLLLQFLIVEMLGFRMNVLWVYYVVLLLL